MKPLVSVVIPCFNVQDYIEEAVQSALDQTYSNIEVICVDNASEDDTWKRLQEIKIKHPEIILSQEAKKGAPAARNCGIQNAKGEWVQFLDADDLLLPEKIEHQIKLLMTFEKTDFGYISAKHFKQNLAGLKEEEMIEQFEDNFMNVFMNSSGITSSNLFSKAAVLEIKGWDEQLKSSQETDFMFRILAQGYGCIYDEKPLTIVRERESGQISHRNPVSKWKTYCDVRAKMIEWLMRNKSDYWQMNRDFYLSYLISSILILMKYSSTGYKQYTHLFSKKFITKPIAGLNESKAKLINRFGVNAFFYSFGLIKSLKKQ